jgi:hypothetical protein
VNEFKARYKQHDASLMNVHLVATQRLAASVGDSRSCASPTVRHSSRDVTQESQLALRVTSAVMSLDANAQCAHCCD